MELGLGRRSGAGSRLRGRRTASTCVDLAWPDQRVAVVLDGDGDEGRDGWLAGHGWTVLPPDAEAVRAALTGAGEA